MLLLQKLLLDTLSFQNWKSSIRDAEVLDSWKKVDNAIVSLSSVGLTVDDEAASDAKEAVAAAQALLHKMFPAVLATVLNQDEEVRLALLPFLQAYVNKLRHTLKRAGTLPEVEFRSTIHN